MSIAFFKDSRIFKLDSGSCSYVFKIDFADAIVKCYFGPKIDSVDIDGLMGIRQNRAFAPYPEGATPKDSRDQLAQEFGTFGVGDYRTPSAKIRDKNGFSVTDIRYKSHKIYAGKSGIEGLPATFGSDNNTETLELTLVDKVSEIEYILYYSTFKDVSAIARSVKVVNRSKDTVWVEKLTSATLDFEECELDLISLPGRWAKERSVERAALRQGVTTLSSGRGLSSHQMNPSFILAEPEANENWGRAYGVALLYSGNFAAEIEKDQFSAVRTQIGINSDNFSWKLESGAEFHTPEAVLVFSNNGLGELSRNFHDLFRSHLIRSYWRDLKRPILINNWEATYFDFNSEKLLSIAKDAATLGIEMLVLDDGWFGHREDDASSLGDWFVNEDKLGGTMHDLVAKINALGLKFGLWFEPEMISRDSRLFEQHPDWILRVPGRTLTEGRNQLVLDMSRQDVVDYLYETISNILDNANIEYIKWDANRHLTEVGSALLPADQQGEVSHRYVLGMYELHERLLKRFPKLLIEGCSGGGGRFDAGMLYYTPQIWTSDDTDAIERLAIQYGTSMIYPCSTMGAHVSDCPNHQTRRVTPFETRGVVAFSGTFGYELDVNKMNEEERILIKEQVATYHRINNMVAQGDLYRLTSPYKATITAWQHVAKDKSETLLSAVYPYRTPQFKVVRLHLQGLIPEALYKNTTTGKSYRGELLMNVGISLPVPRHDGDSLQIHFVKE